MESTLSPPCSHSDLPLSCQGATLAHLMIWYSELTVLFLFLLAKAAVAYLPIALSVALRPLFPSQQAHFAKVSAEACAILQALCWSWQHQQVCLFSSSMLLSDSRSVLTTLSSLPSFRFTSISLAGTVFSLLLFYQATMGPQTLVFPGKQCG